MVENLHQSDLLKPHVLEGKRGVVRKSTSSGTVDQCSVPCLLVSAHAHSAVLEVKVLRYVGKYQWSSPEAEIRHASSNKCLTSSNNKNLIRIVITSFLLLSEVLPRGRDSPASLIGIAWSFRLMSGGYMKSGLWRPSLFGWMRTSCFFWMKGRPRPRSGSLLDMLVPVEWWEDMPPSI